MNFEEMLNVQEGQKPHRESTPLGSYYRRQVDGKYRYVIELRPELTDSIVFCEALKQEQQWSVRQRGKQQLHYEVHQDSNDQLYELELEKRRQAAAKVEAGKKKIEWGSQIRSYVFDDRRVKDHRTNYQTSNVNAVMDGDLDAFIKAYLMEFPD